MVRSMIMDIQQTQQESMSMVHLCQVHDSRQWAPEADFAGQVLQAALEFPDPANVSTGNQREDRENYA